MSNICKIKCQNIKQHVKAKTRNVKTISTNYTFDEMPAQPGARQAAVRRLGDAKRLTN